MLPILAIGAFFTGTLIVGAASAKAEPSVRSKAVQPQVRERLASPTAYVVVPMQQSENIQKGEPVSVADLIGKMIF